MYKKIKPFVSGRNATHPARGIAIINNQKVKFLSFSTEQNGFSAADSFEVVLPFFIQDTQNGENILANGSDFQSILLTQDIVPVQLYVGYPKNALNYTINDLTQIMDGTMDTARWNFDINGETITINGRNIVGKMIDSKIVDKYPNMTSSSIANMLAIKYGLTPVITPTSTLAGTYYNSTSTLMANTDTTEWDLLLFLAQQENFIVRVKNDQLMFGPYSVVTSYEDNTPIPYTWGYDIESLDIERSPHAARDIVVNVISYDRDHKNKIKETARSSTQRSQNSQGQIARREQYVETYTIPGLTRDQAQKKAQTIYNELSRSQIIGQISGAGNTNLAVDKLIQLNGIGQGLSTNYYLNKVGHKFDLTGGYSMESSFSNQFMSDSTEVSA